MDGLILKDIRQLLLFGYKAEYVPIKSQLDEAQASFLATEEMVATYARDYFPMHGSDPLFRGARALVSRAIYRINYWRICPSHGPGAVFPACRPSEKSKFRTIYSTIECLYPFYEFFIGTENGIAEARILDRDISLSDKIIAKLVAVPKDSRGPRLITVHPKEAIWIQQGLRNSLEQAVEHCELTRGFVNFEDQSINAQLALHSSRSGKYSTIDLKDASDSISLELFEYLFGGAAKWFTACRATEVKLLDGSCVKLSKYAAMGNATVFPVESLIFWALIRSGIRCYHGVNCDDIYVFGDDIIVPSQFYDASIKSLVRAGLKPNPTKCFHRGLFRESCGVDAFNGIDVTPHRMKRFKGSSLLDLVSLCALAKNLRRDGYEETASHIYSIVRRRQGYLNLSNFDDCQGIVEYVERDVSYLYRNEPSFRWNSQLHRYETSVIGTKACIDVPCRHDWYHVQDSILRNAGKSLIANTPFEYSFPRRARRTRGWIPVSMVKP
jgi:hypothetical protein